MTLGRRAGAALIVLSLTWAPAATLATRAHAQASDAEGADAGDVSGGEGGAGSSGVLPSGNQNDALPGDSACFADDGCDVSFDSQDARDWFASDAFALDG